jgi:hypothetical protein
MRECERFFLFEQETVLHWVLSALDCGGLVSPLNEGR